MKIYFLTMSNTRLPFDFIDHKEFQDIKKILQWVKSLEERAVILTDVELTPFQVRNTKINIISISKKNMLTRCLLNEVLRLTQPDLEE